MQADYPGHIEREHSEDLKKIFGDAKEAIERGAERVEIHPHPQKIDDCVYLTSSSKSDVLYLHSQCHTESPTWAFVDGSGILTIVCAVCEAVIVKFRITDEPDEMP